MIVVDRDELSSEAKKLVERVLIIYYKKYVKPLEKSHDKLACEVERLKEENKILLTDRTRYRNMACKFMEQRDDALKRR